jgi:hypothetical protein
MELFSKNIFLLYIIFKLIYFILYRAEILDKRNIEKLDQWFKTGIQSEWRDNSAAKRLQKSDRRGKIE